MTSWPIRSFREAGIRLIDCVHKTPAAQSSGYPYVAIPQMKNGRIDFSDARRISHADFVEWTKKARPQVHDVVLSRRTNPGVTATFGNDVDFALGQNLVLLRADGSVVNPEFLRWLVVCPDWWVEIEKYNNVGAVFDSLKCADVPNFRLPIPPKPVQISISELLASMDDKIELNRGMNETLEAMVQAIFRDWFVDFGPVRRKLEGTTDPVAIMGGLVSDPARAAELAGLFPDGFSEDELPVEWEMAPLEETLILQRGFDLPKTARTDGKYPVIAASGPSGTHNEFKVEGPGVCTGRSGVLGNVYFVNDDFWPLNTSLWIKAFPNSTPLYAYHILREIDLSAFNAGSAVPTLNRNHIHGLPVTKPPMAIVQAFDHIGTLLYDKIQANDGENRTLAETRDYLLPRLMSGEVRVGDAAQEIAA